MSSISVKPFVIDDLRFAIEEKHGAAFVALANRKS
jgi:hypothetical protein